jgi:hypothetical protein
MTHRNGLVIIVSILCVISTYGCTPTQMPMPKSTVEELPVGLATAEKLPVVAPAVYTNITLIIALFCLIMSILLIVGFGLWRASKRRH